ncbi:hypothetical protein BH09BAC5_BH09BAC5_10970 [soil metagenome]
MKTIRYIAILSLAVYAFWVNTNRAHATSSDYFVLGPDTSETPDQPSLLYADTAQPESENDAVSFVADSTDEDGDAPSHNEKAHLVEREDTPAWDLYDEWDTLSVHAEKFDALTFDDTIRIPLRDPGHCKYVHPFNGPTTSAFAFRSYRYHFGVDINLETGDTVRCAFDGKVRIAQKSKTYGYVVVIRHNNGLETYYAHLSKLLVTSGDDIEAGMVLGLGGNTGHSFGSHLHFEMRFRGVAINPNYLIDFKNQTLRTDTYNLTKSDFKYLTESYKVRHYSRKKKKTWYTYYCPGGAHYATAQARAIMAKVPAPQMPDTPATGCVAPENQNPDILPNTIPGNFTSKSPTATSTHTKTTPTKTQVREPIASGSAVYYTVKSGDSLYAIALRNHTTVDKLCALNHISKTSILNVGKKLRIK